MSKQRKIVLITSITILILMVVFVWLYYNSQINLKAINSYSAKIIKQEPNNEIKLRKGQINKIIIQYKNNGIKTWQKKDVKLRLISSKTNVKASTKITESNLWIPNSNFYNKIILSENNNSGWVNPREINFLENSVKKNEIANFIFYIQAPFEEGQYKEDYQLVYYLNGQEKVIYSKPITINVKVSNEFFNEPINKNSDIYKKIENEFKNEIEPEKIIENIQKQIKNSRDLSEKINLYQNLADLQIDKNINSAINTLKKAREEILKIEDKNERNKKIKEIDEKIENLEQYQKEEEEIEQKKEAKTVANNVQLITTEKSKIDKNVVSQLGEYPSKKIENKTTANKPIKVAGVTAGGIVSGAIAGGAVGNVFPGIGTAVGALGGALIGGVSGLVGGLIGF